MNVLQRLSKIVLAMILGVSLAGPVLATEGTAEIRNTRGESARCWAASVLMRDFNYKILLSCRDLKYPVDSGAFNYTIWVQEEGKEELTPLGDVGIGKREFTIKEPFTRYVVTEELSSGPKTPSDRVIMEGPVRPIGILDSGTQTTTPTSDESETDIGAFGQSNTNNSEPVVTPNNVPSINSSSSTNSAFSAIKIVGGVAIIAILLVIVIALVSASRRRPIDL